MIREDVTRSPFAAGGSMAHRHFSHRLVLSLATGLILAGGIADPARAAPRTVLGELFSSAG
jgi:hypothetical protein